MIGDIFNLNNIIGAFINAFGYIYMWSKLSDKKIDFKNFRYYVVNLVLAIFLILNYLLVSDIVRIILLVIVMSLLCYFIFKKDLINNFVICFFSQLIMMVSELIFLFFLLVVFKTDINTLVSSYFANLFVNLFITIIGIIIINFKFVKKIYLNITKLMSNLKEYNMVLIMIIILATVNFLFASIYNKMNLILAVCINIMMSSIYLIICFKFIKTQNKYYKINDKYNTTLNSLKEYEDILDVYRVSNHENKNQLLTIRSMIVKEEKNIPEYIDKIIDNKIKDDEKLMFDTNTIPAGGLRAVIYSKLLVMKDKKIKFNLNVDYKVRTVDLIELGEDLMLDICKVIGVFLDNAIEAVEDIKRKNIKINLFTDGDYLHIEISNNFENDLDLTKIDNKGYTSKTKGHGYGLSLVKEIIDKNSNLINERKINKNIFTQVLKIKHQ